MGSEKGFLTLQQRTWGIIKVSYITLPETNMAPETEWLEDEFPFAKAFFFRRRAESFR